MLKKFEYNFTDVSWHKIANKKNIWISWRFNVICKILKESGINLNKYKKCSDIGSGKGTFASDLSRLSNFSIDCFDVDRKNKQKLIKGNFYLHDIKIKKKKFKNKYDIIFLLDVLEHIDKDSSFIRDCKYYLKKNGFLIINVPAVPWLFSKYDLAVGHIRRYTIKKISYIMKKNKLENIKLYYWGFLLLPFLIIRTFIISKLKLKKNELIKTGMDTNSFLKKTILQMIYFIDFYMLKINFFGTSIVGVFKK